MICPQCDKKMYYHSNEKWREIWDCERCKIIVIKIKEES